MLRLSQLETGPLALDASDHPGFFSSPIGLELQSNLFVVDVSDCRMIFETPGRVAETIIFVRDWVQSHDIRISIEPILQSLLDRASGESQLILSVRKKKTSLARGLHIPKKIVKRPLLRHQLRAVEHALRVQNAANFSVPGSGKTAVALAVFGILKKEGIIDRLLVIGPASSFVPWISEFTETLGYAPRVARIIGSKSVRIRTIGRLAEYELALCTYQMAYREKENLIRELRHGKYLLILDESHHIKNIEIGPWANTVMELSSLAVRRMVLTGTPAPYSILDLWTQMTFLWPSQLLLGTRQEFQKSVDSSADPVRTCRQQISKFYWRTKKSDLSLPKPEFHYETLPDSDIPKRQKLIIRLLELKTMQEVRDSGLQTTDQDILRRWRRARVLRLLQAASNPTLLSLRMDGLGDEGGPLDKDPMLISLLRDYHRHEIPAKIRFVVSMATELCTRGQKVVIWATFVENLKLLQKLLKDMHPLMVYGAVPAFQEEDDLNFESRERNIQLFKTREDRNILLANPAACAESISLHKVCHHAVYLERTFNCGQFLQSMDRIHRVGMPRGSHPHYYVPLIRCAIEQVVDRRLRDRQSVLYRLLNDNMPVSGYAGDENFFFDSDGDLESILKEITGEISLSSNGENT